MSGVHRSLPLAPYPSPISSSFPFTELLACDSSRARFFFLDVLQRDPSRPNEAISCSHLSWRVKFAPQSSSFIANSLPLCGNVCICSRRLWASITRPMRSVSCYIDLTDHFLNYTFFFSFSLSLVHYIGNSAISSCSIYSLTDFFPKLSILPLEQFMQNMSTVIPRESLESIDFQGIYLSNQTWTCLRSFASRCAMSELGRGTKKSLICDSSFLPR